MSPLLAQQPQAVDRDPRARVETPDPTVNSVNPDPENQNQAPQNLNLYLEKLKQSQDNPKQDAGQRRALPGFATWGPQPAEPQKPSSDFAPRVAPASSWGQKDFSGKDLSSDATALFAQDAEQSAASHTELSKAAAAGENYQSGRQSSLRLGQSSLGQPGLAQPVLRQPGLGQPAVGQPSLGRFAQPRISQARTRLSGNLSLPQSAGYPNTLSLASAPAGEFQATSVDFAAPLVFDPAKMMALDKKKEKAERLLEETQSQSQSAADPTRRAPVTIQAKLRCVQLQKKKDHKVDPQSQLSLP